MNFGGGRVGFRKRTEDFQVIGKALKFFCSKFFDGLQVVH